MFEKALQLIEQSHNIAIISHRNPDGDTLGSNLALHLGIKKKLKISTPICIDHVPSIFNFLPQSDEIVTDFDPQEYDLLFS